MLKQVIVVRADLKLQKGKMSAQVAHASLEAALKTDRRKVDEWRKSGGKKVVVKAKDEAELIGLQRKAEESKMKSALIRDAGKTALQPGTVTCLGIGPEEEKKLDRITGRLKMA